MVIRGERVGQFRTNNGVRQDSPLSPSLFNISMAELETEMKKVQEGGIVIGKKKIYTIGYADGAILLSNNEVGMKQMIRFGRFLERRGLELNTRKSNIGTGPEFKWKEEKIEIVKDATYLGYKIQSNNGDTKHIKCLAGKVNAVLGRIGVLAKENSEKTGREE